MDAYRIEQYYFYRLYSIDFDSTRHSLGVLKRYRRNDVRFCLLRDIVVNYCRPFSGNRGDTTPHHKLSIKLVPHNYLDLHKELLRLRSQQFAHTDKTYRKPKISGFGTGTNRLFPMQFKSYDYSSLCSRVGDIEKLVIAVEKTLHQKISAIENGL